MSTLGETIRIGNTGIEAPHGAVAGSVADFVARLAQRIAAHRAEARARREGEAALAAMSDRVLRDIGLRRDQLPLPGRGV